MSNPQVNTGTYYLEETTSYSGDYSTLSGYNRPPGMFVAGPPVPSQSAVQSVVVVPTYGGSGYNTLQHNLSYPQLSTNGYFNVNNAYPSYGNNCMSYVVPLSE